jgi:hypothetical protein
LAARARCAKTLVLSRHRCAHFHIGDAICTVSLPEQPDRDRTVAVVCVGQASLRWMDAVLCRACAGPHEMIAHRLEANVARGGCFLMPRAGMRVTHGLLGCANVALIGDVNATRLRPTWPSPASLLPSRQEASGILALEAIALNPLRLVSSAVGISEIIAERDPLTLSPPSLIAFSLSCRSGSFFPTVCRRIHGTELSC